jgi:hypothetical protein
MNLLLAPLRWWARLIRPITDPPLAYIERRFRDYVATTENSA